DLELRDVTDRAGILVHAECDARRASRPLAFLERRLLHGLTQKTTVERGEATIDGHRAAHTVLEATNGRTGSRMKIETFVVTGGRSLAVALVAAVFTGMVFARQSAINMARFGAEAYVGPVSALAILRELGPVLTAILVGGKVASGITAELGSMKVTEQIDALRTLGVNYVKRLIVPRLLAAVVVFPLLPVLSDAVGVLGRMIIMNLERGADMYTYWNVTTYWVVPRDFLMGVGKSFFFGGIVTLIGCYNGLSVEGGTEGLGRATTATVVHVT